MDLFRKLMVVLLALFCINASALVGDEIYTYYYSEQMANGQLLGTFVGHDGNGDGYLDSSEVTVFNFSYFASDGSSYQFNPGNVPLAVFYPDIFAGGGFLYKLSSTVAGSKAQLGDDFGEFIAVGLSGYVTGGFSLVADSSGGTFAAPLSFLHSDITSQLVQTTLIWFASPIPEPETCALMLVGLVGIRIRRNYPFRITGGRAFYKRRHHAFDQSTHAPHLSPRQ